MFYWGATAVTTSVIHQVTNITSGRESTAKTWLKAIELTSRIEADPRRGLSQSKI
jgi:hypothetical protein